jgi:NAD(P)-dependent dehydrogenase (short-subunit alcohol dehydrogenase family)
MKGGIVVLKSMTLENKVALVTGAGRGIGRSLALGLAEAGADVILTSRTMEQLVQVADEIKAMGRRAMTVTMDARNWDSIQGAVDQAISEMGSIDILVNNAGITIKMPAEDYTREDWDQVISTNLTGVFACAQAVGRQMIKNGYGKIINMASVGGQTALTGSIAYCAAKGGILQITRTLAAEWAKYNINVNAIGPAYIETPMVEKVMEERPELSQRIKDRTPMGRLGKPEEVVGAAIFLASDAASYVNGETIFVDGGWTAYGI